ncbi:zinc finger CCCH domain-containing protein 39-like isoform X2 [Triticum urartu]|uniref:zinc finger CCCH domain-containing protein 39-like isoform X2 n=1 Tax=Triticum urartu TaxID=4572 RepID=UPI0020431D39|nr:zinc finger CCCH domain-containing protein 39-like isoform X2 [Triticum urartu]
MRTKSSAATSLLRRHAGRRRCSTNSQVRCRDPPPPPQCRKLPSTRPTPCPSAPDCRPSAIAASAPPPPTGPSSTAAAPPSSRAPGRPRSGAAAPPSPRAPGPRRPAPPGSSSASSSSGSRVDAAATEHGLRMARLALQYQDFANRYQLCLSHLADAAREAAAIRHDNSGLRLANNVLASRFAVLGGNQASAVALAEQLHRLHLGQMQAQAVPAPPVLPMPMAPRLASSAEKLRPLHPGQMQAQVVPAPPPMPRARPASPAEKHAAMPKSISIRSNGYLKMDRNGKHRVTAPVNVGSRVFVGVDGAKAEEHQGRGGEKGGQVATAADGLQFEVYSQGMFKTELCNKWEESGACPYGDQCQFAHGIAELRPIIRHPRYKTQVCRMVIGGAICPYGHRCHFRHSITPADYIPLLHP